MKTLFLKLKGASTIAATVLIDNKPVKFKKNTYGGYETSFETSSDHANVKIYKYLEINNKLWWLVSWLFFIISIFGILEPRYDKRCLVIEAEFDISLNSPITEVVMAVNRISENNKAISVETKTEYTEKINRYFIDYKAKKRLKTMKIVKWLTFVLTIAIAILLLVKFIIK